jgi:hypothetical protein
MVPGGATRRPNAATAMLIIGLAGTAAVLVRLF